MDRDEFDASLREVAGAPVRGLLRLTAPLAFGRRHVTPLVTEYLALHPEAQVELVLADRNLDLIEEGLHLAVRIGPLPDSGLMVRRLGSVRRIVVAAPAYLAQRGTPRKPGELMGHDTIASVAAGQTLTWRFGGGRGASVAITPRLIVNEIEAALVAARSGHGIARALSYQAADDIASGALLRILREHEPPPLPVQIVTPAGLQLSPKVRAFIDLAVERLPRHAPIGDEGRSPPGPSG